MSVIETIRKKLESAFQPLELEILDESENHRGHAGWREGGETHFHVRPVWRSNLYNNSLFPYFCFMSW